MGAWGQGIMENDDASSFLGERDYLDVKKINKVLKQRGIAAHDYDMFLAACSFLISANQIVANNRSDDAKKLLLSKINEILNDGDYLEDWDDPPKKKRIIQKLKRQLEVGL